MLRLSSEGRPGHLVRVHEALLCLPEAEQRRLGVIVRLHGAEHRLTYRQVEYTYGLIARALSKERPDGAPSELLCEVIDRLLEASVVACAAPTGGCYAIDWSALEAWSRPPRRDGRCTDPEAAWGHRTVNCPGESETFFGYYLQAVTMLKEERGAQVPELVARIHLASPKHDPPAQIVGVLKRMAGAGAPISDLLCDCGYSYRDPAAFALPLRAIGAKLVMDIHPNDRGMKGTHQGAVICGGALYCPAAPEALLELSPLAPRADQEQIARQERCEQELSRYKLSPISGYDKDGYRRVACPAVAGKVRCPLRPASMALSYQRASVSCPPAHPPRCCTQQTITVAPSVGAKTAQKHDYPSAAHRRSYARRSAAERTFASVYDAATNNLARGHCRLRGLAPIALFCATVFVARNLRIADSFAARRAQEARERAKGLPARRRRGRRGQAGELAGAANAPPPAA